MNAGQFYIPVYLFQAIPFDKLKILDSLGVYAPFESKNPEFNTYAYIPEERPDLFDIVEAHCGKFQKLSRVPVSSIKKNIDKIAEVNKINVSDWVQCKSEWKTLPFKVISVNESSAVIHCPLRGQSLEIERELELLQLLTTDEVSQLEHYHIKIADRDIREKILAIDCDSFHTTSILHLKEFITTLIKAKFLAPEHKVLVLNPDIKIYKLSAYLGLGVMFGNPLTAKIDLIYTKTRALQSFFKNYIETLDSGNFEIKEAEPVDGYLEFFYPNMKERDRAYKRAEIQEQIKANHWVRELKSKVEGVVGEVSFFEADQIKAMEYLNDNGLGYFADGAYTLIELFRS